MRRCVLTVALLPLLAAGGARAERHLFRSFTGEDGLSQLAVGAMAQDANGYLWVGTESDLNRFDGRRFEAFGVRDGLGDSEISALAALPGGGLLVGTRVGLDRLVDGRFEDYGGPRGLRVAQVVSLATGPSGGLWVGTERGLAVLRGERFVYPEALAAESITSLHRDPGGTVWVGARQALWRLRGEALERVIDSPMDGDISALAAGPTGRVYAGAMGVVHVFHEGAWRSQITLGTRSRPAVYALHVDAVGALWIGDELGLLRQHRGRLQRFGPPDRFRVTNLTSILTDADGFVWAGGFGGVARFVGAAFTIYDEADGLPAANSRPVLRTRAGELWVGTVNGLVRKTGPRFEAFGAPHGLDGNYVLALYEDAKGMIWVGTQRGLSVQVGPQRWARRHVSSKDGAVNSIVEDEQGRVWLAMNDKGVFRSEGSGFEHVPIPDNTFNSPRLIIGADQRIWVSGDRGLSVGSADGWRTYGQAEGLAGQRPYFLAEGPAGHIWFGYHEDAGLSRFDGTRFETWTTAEGLTDGSVYSLGFDAAGALWVGTARGVDRFVDGRFQNYGPAEGYPSTESNSGGFLLDGDGKLWFGTAEGLAHYDPGMDRWRGAGLRLGLGGLRLGPQRLGASGVLAHRRDAALEVELELVGFDHPRNVELRARLRGLSERWTQLAEPRWSVPGLSPGDYRLEVQARRQKGGWSATRAVDFEIAPPWWQTPWSRGLLGVLLALLVALAFRLRRGQAASLREMEALRAASETKSQFVANVSHELRTPMNAIMGMTELALAEPVAPRVREYLQTVQSSAGALLELLDDLLDLPRVESGKLALNLAPMSLRALAEGLRATYQSTTPEAVELTVEVEAGLQDDWRADAGRLRQVLVNLVGNALKFTQEGHVRVRVKAGGAPDRLRFSVEDSGIGIPETARDLVFEKFTQVDGSSTREAGGTGLGLAICRELVRLMGGEIELRSTVGKGSTFTFTAQLEPLEGAPATEAHFTPPPAHAPLKVLVAEDNPVNQLVVQRMLEALGHAVRVVDDGAQAVEAVGGGGFDVVFMDLQMPRVDGIEAVQRIRAGEGSERVPIVALTAHAMVGDRERTMAAGADAYLTKPVSRQALARVLGNLSRGEDPQRGSVTR